MAGEDGAGGGTEEDEVGRVAGRGGGKRRPARGRSVRAGSSLPCVLGSQHIPEMKNKNTSACLNKNRSPLSEYRTMYLMLITTTFYVRCYESVGVINPL